MKKNLFLNKLILLLVLLVATSCANSDPGQSANELAKKISHDLNKKLIVIVYRMYNQDRSSEQYADWSANLNEFVASNSKYYKVYESDKEFENSYLSKHIKPDESYTLFIRKGQPGYLYKGVIVEPMVYMAVNNTYLNNILSPMDQAFLPERVALDIK